MPGDRPRDASGMTDGELGRAKRDLLVSLSLAFPGSPVRVPILGELGAIDTELAARAMTEPTTRKEASVAEIVDCVERMLQFKQRCPGAEFDLKPDMFTARVPGRDEPFRAISLCNLMNALDRWASEQTTAPLPSGTRAVRAPGQDR